MAEVPEITTAVARTLQALRADRGWSLDQLAARSGVSKGVLVALEQGRSNPNLATLARIGDAFGVPVTLLVDVGGEPAVRVSSPDASRVLWRGPSGGTGTIIGATDPPWAVELWRWEVMPGETFGGDAHAPATREMVWVEQGTLTLTVAGERYALGPGQCARFPGQPPAPLRQRGPGAGPPHHGGARPAGRRIRNRRPGSPAPGRSASRARRWPSRGPRPCRGRAPGRSPRPWPAPRAAPYGRVPRRGTSRGTSAWPRPPRRRGSTWRDRRSSRRW